MKTRNGSSDTRHLVLELLEHRTLLATQSQVAWPLTSVNRSQMEAPPADRKTTFNLEQSAVRPIITALAPPIANSPNGAVSSTNPTFQWSPIRGASHYQIQIADITSGTNDLVLPPKTVASTSFALHTPLSVDHTYQWQIRAVNSSGATGPWSNRLTFNVVLPPPASIFSTTPPPALGQIKPRPPLAAFGWSAVPDAASYSVKLTDITLPIASTLVATNVSLPAYQVSAPLTAGHTYQFQVATNTSSGETGTPSPPVTFIATGSSVVSASPALPSGVTGVSGIPFKRKLAGFTVTFSQALEAANSVTGSFFQVERETVSHKKTLFGNPIPVSVSYQSGQTVTVRLPKPVKQTLQLIVLPGIVTADGTASDQSQPFVFT